MCHFPREEILALALKSDLPLSSGGLSDCSLAYEKHETSVVGAEKLFSMHVKFAIFLCSRQGLAPSIK